VVNIIFSYSANNIIKEYLKSGWLRVADHRVTIYLEILETRSQTLSQNPNERPYIISLSKLFRKTRMKDLVPKSLEQILSQNPNETQLTKAFSKIITILETI
jgi:hypothetical protein